MHVTHGKCHTRIYSIWENMLQRCQNENNPKWDIYGGRGISISERWKTFKNFHDDMGDPPDDTTLDRIDPDGNYCKDNCRWATTQVQTRNKRNNRIIEFDGRKQVLQDWAKELKIDSNTLWGRLDQGWTVERAFTTPARGINHELRSIC